MPAAVHPTLLNGNRTLVLTHDSLNFAMRLHFGASLVVPPPPGSSAGTQPAHLRVATSLAFDDDPPRVQGGDVGIALASLRVGRARLPGGGVPLQLQAGSWFDDPPDGPLTFSVLYAPGNLTEELGGGVGGASWWLGAWSGGGDEDSSSNRRRLSEGGSAASSTSWPLTLLPPTTSTTAGVARIPDGDAQGVFTLALAVANSVGGVAVAPRTVVNL